VISAPPASEWGALVKQLGLSAMALQVAINCALTERNGDVFRLTLEPGYAQMLTKGVEERIRAALEQYLGRPVTLKFQIGAVNAATPAIQQKQQQAERQQTAAEQIRQDPHVRDMQEMFDAKIAAVHPLDDTDGTH
jgi:DNA polymerase-3 subunit gamma/tau